MSGTVARRAVRFVVTVLIVTFATACLADLVPGDPAVHLAGEHASPETVAAINERYGFDDPLLVRYSRWLSGLVQGDFGTSHLTRQPVFHSISERFPVTFQIATMSTLLSLAVAVPLAMATARRVGSKLDRLAGAVTSGLVSVPAFVFAVVFVYLFAFRWQVLPSIGWVPFTEDPVANLRSTVLPVLSVSFTGIVVLYRVLRVDLAETLQQDHVALARSKGLSPRAIMWRHVLRPSSLSLVTLTALQLARFLAGTIVVESIFVLPGLGLLIVNAVDGRDIVALQGIVLFLALVFLVTNFLVDLLYGVLDPRTRAQS